VTPEAHAQKLIEREVVELYEAHAASLLRYASSLARGQAEANDAVQEAFLRYFVERRYGRQIQNPQAWLYQVLHNFLVTVLSRAAAQNPAPVDALDSLPALESDPETIVECRERAQAIAQSLTARELDCLRLRTEGRSYAEISGLLHIRSGTVGALLARAYQKLRWPPGKDGVIGPATASAVNLLFLEMQPAEPTRC
jgi:RNA polymerase sigma factor (sigma-70 family)